MYTGAIVAALAAASTVHAHATFQYLWVGDVDQGTKCIRPPANNSPITDLKSKEVACNNNGDVAAAAICPIAAGSKATAEMHQHSDRGCKEEAIGGNHDGPTTIYMAKVDNAATAVGSEANWFKVAEVGLVKKDYWGSDVMNANCGKVEFTVPSDISAGNYLIRAESIALHAANAPGGAQLYMSCYQVNVTGGDTASPSTVKLPGAYLPTDPGLLFNLFGSDTNYTVPGPPVYSSGGASGNATKVVTGDTPGNTTEGTSGGSYGGAPGDASGGAYGGAPKGAAGGAYGGVYEGSSSAASTKSEATSNSAAPTTTGATSATTTTSGVSSPPTSTTSVYATSSAQVTYTPFAKATSTTTTATAVATSANTYPSGAPSTSAVKPVTSTCKGHHGSRYRKHRRRVLGGST